MLNKIKEFMSHKDEELYSKKSKKQEQIEEPQDEVLDQKIGELTAELDESKDKYLRLFAEFDNYKKRSVKERFDLMKTAGQEIITSLLPILDDFDRARKSAESGAEAFSEGVNLVYHKLFSTLEHKGLKAMESTGADFDPEFHEAIADIPAPNEELKGKVIETVEKGYLLNDKIIRHAKVVVAK